MEQTAKKTNKLSPSVWVTGYVDQSKKCGFGFLLSDRSVSVGFNDGTSMVLEPNGVAFDYINRARPCNDEETKTTTAGAVNEQQKTIQTRHTLNDFPRELQSKVHLLEDFRSYVHKLANCDEGNASDGGDNGVRGNNNATSSAEQQTKHHQQQLAVTTTDKPFVFVEQFRRTPQMVLFRLSNRTVQVVFSDKTEVLLSEEARLLTYVDNNGKRETFTSQRVVQDNRVEIIERMRSSNRLLNNVLRDS